MCALGRNAADSPRPTFRERTVQLVPIMSPSTFDVSTYLAQVGVEVDHVIALCSTLRCESKPVRIAFASRIMGYGYESISRELGVCKMTAWRYIQRDCASIRRMMSAW